MLRMWRGSIHRQRDEGRYHLHPLQLRILLQRGDERALLAVFGREVVSEWAAVMLSGKEVVVVSVMNERVGG